jgi:hypothetical protein
MELRVGQVWRSPDTGNRWKILALILGAKEGCGKVRVERLPPRGKWDDGFYVFHVEQFRLLQLEPEQGATHAQPGDPGEGRPRPRQ